MKAAIVQAFDQPLVVGVDGSEPSLRAVDWAADEAALRGGHLGLQLGRVAHTVLYYSACPVAVVPEPV